MSDHNSGFRQLGEDRNLGERSVRPITLSLVVPVFNEDDSIQHFLDHVTTTLGPVDDLRLEVVFVNDGSTDQTLATLLNANPRNAAIRIVDLSRNFGKEAALTAGFDAATGQVIVPIDVDLQDPPEVILAMLDQWKDGYDVVLGKRVDRSSDNLLKRKTAGWYYRFHNRISDLRIPENVGDFRLMDRKVVDALATMPESTRFMKGLYAWIGFRTTTVEFTRDERRIGTSKFTGWKLWNFALDGITSFSTSPLRMWTYLGGIVAGTAFGFALLILLRVLIFGTDIPGYASLAVAVTFLGGLQLIGIGIIGEYLGRTFVESKRRPIYVIQGVYERNT